MFIAKSGSAKQEIDLRGMTLDEAIPVVDKAIDDALIAGIGQLRLIHGKGTGALRAGLTAYLSTNRFVKSWKRRHWRPVAAALRLLICNFERSI